MYSSQGLLTFTGFHQFQDYHLLTLPFDCESIRTVLFREYEVADYDDSQFIIDLQGLSH